MQTARKAVSPTLALVKLAAGVQTGENQLNNRCIFFRVHAKRNSAAIVFNGHRAIGVQNHLELFTVPGQGFVGRIVQYFLDDVQRVVSAGVHARALLDGLQPLEHTDGRFRIVRRRFGRHSPPL